MSTRPRSSPHNILSRLRRPGETFDATMLLMIDWRNDDLDVGVTIYEPADDLSASCFFADLVTAVTDRAPISEHQDVRLRRDGAPTGGLPEDDAFELDSDY